MPVWKQLLFLIVVAALGAGGYWGYEKYYAPAEDAGGGSRGAREVPVEVAHASFHTMRRTVEAVGTTRARQSIQIVPLASGRVVEVAFRPGQHVEKDDVLVRLDDDIERANLQEAEAQKVEQTQALERAEQLRGTNAVSPQTLERAAAAKAAADAAVDRARRRLADRVIRAPFAGIVGLSDIDIGARVDDDTVLTTLDDLSEVEVEFSLPETLFAEVNSEQLVTARSAAFADRMFEGRIADIDSRIDPVSRAFRTRAVIPNPGDVLPAGMFMSLTLILSETEELVVPEEAIVVQAADTFVFLVADGKAVRTTVVTGQRRDGQVAIMSGISSGDAVITRGLQRVRDGSVVNVLGEVADTPDAAATEQGS